MCSRLSACALALLFGLASPLAAQRVVPLPPTPDDWRHGTTLTASSGITSDDSASRVSVGGALGWELSPRLTREGSGEGVSR